MLRIPQDHQFRQTALLENTDHNFIHTRQEMNMVVAIEPLELEPGRLQLIQLRDQFRANLGAANPAEKANMLSSSISVAMNTTALGLIVAIPLLLVHSVLQSKTTSIVDSLEMASVKFLNTVVERRPETA